MVLAQFLITPANNNTVFPLGISGKASIRVLGIEYSDTSGGGGNPDKRIIQIVSDSLYFPYSPAKFITFLSNASSTAVIDNGKSDYHLTNVALNSGIRLQVIDRATGAEPGDFVGCVLTLSIEALNRNVEVE
jgi:hypothetical protein